MFSDEEKEEFLARRNDLLRDIRRQTWMKGVLGFSCGAAASKAIVGVNSKMQILKTKKNSPSLTAFPLIIGCLTSFVISFGYLDNRLHDMEYFVYQKYLKTEKRKQEIKEKQQNLE